MSNSTQFSFFVENGFKGNLVTDPEVCETHDGEEYAKLTLYVAADQYENNRTERDDQLTLSANVRIYDEDVIEEAMKELGKGDFVNFSGFSSLRIGRYISEHKNSEGEEKTVIYINVDDYKLLKKSEKQSKKVAKKTTRVKNKKHSFRRKKAA